MKIGFCLFPNVTQLDFTGPLQVVHRIPHAEVFLAAETMSAVASDCDLSLVPTTTFADCPDLDVVIVPGGPGVSNAIRNEHVMEFIKRTAKTATYVCSVCTGAFILGAAGLLNGKEATTHWAYTQLLPMVGATYKAGRVVRDGNTFTGGGVTAGIDFGLTITAELAGTNVAEQIQLVLEYNPQPPYNSGHPNVASDTMLSQMKETYVGRVARLRDALKAASLA